MSSDISRGSLPESPAKLTDERNEDGTLFTTDDYISWVIGTTISWALHPDSDSHALHLQAEASLKQHIKEMVEEARMMAGRDLMHVIGMRPDDGYKSERK